MGWSCRGTKRVSVLADYGAAAAVLSVATAVVPATQAALDPAGTAKKHRAAAHGYERIGRKLEDSAWFETKEHDRLVLADQHEPLRNQLQALDGEMSAATSPSSLVPAVG